jgi:hypothetical protein
MLALLQLIGIVLGVALIVLYFHSCLFGTWKENFSKDGLKKHAKDLGIFLVIGAALMVGWEIVKSTFSKKK